MGMPQKKDSFNLKTRGRLRGKCNFYKEGALPAVNNNHRRAA